MRLAYDYRLVIALCLLMVSDAFGKDEDLETVSLDWIVYKNKLLNVAKRSGPSSTTEVAWTGRWMPERTTKAPVSTSTGEESWTGRWMPEHTTPKAGLSSNLNSEQFSPDYKETDFTNLRLRTMGTADKYCDDGKTNTTIDWDESPVNYTCLNQLRRFEPNFKYAAELEEELIPPAYQPAHLCMDHAIEYAQNVPTFGNHRPLWPKYGEYKFLPRQRWLHSIEHGAIVMLYHPCAHPVEIKMVKKILTGCVRRHIITPHTLVDKDRPIVLVAWGARLSMSWANVDMIRNFIKLYAFNSPEGANSVDGQYDHLLQVPAVVVTGSDIDDSNICPGQWA